MGWTVYEDYIMWQIRMAIQLLLQILRLRKKGELATAREKMGDAYRELLGADAHMFLYLDSKTGAGLIGNPEKTAVLADLFHEDAELMRAEKHGSPQNMERRALEYAIETFIVAPLSKKNTSRIRKFAQYVRREILDSRYRQVLEELKI